MSIKIKKVDISECSSLDDLVVVIDVLRAFTTAAFAFNAGAKEIIAVGDINHAFDVYNKIPESILIGEQHGVIIPGFHFGNSPVEIAKQDLKGKTLIQRTTAGTQGVSKSKNAKKMLVSSFVVAEATLKRIKFLNPSNIGFVITGDTDGSEDLALAEYIEAKLINPSASHESYVEKVKNSMDAACYGHTYYPGDLEAACEVDLFSFAMEVFFENGLNIIRPVKPTEFSVN